MAYPITNEMLGIEPNYSPLQFNFNSMPFTYGQGFTNPNVQQAVSNVANKIHGFNGVASGDWSRKLFGNQGIIGGIGSGLAALGQVGAGIFNAIMAGKEYELAKKILGYQIGLGNRNLANQAKIINNTYDIAGNVGAGLIGYQDANGNYGGVDSNILASQQEQAKKNYVDGSPIRI